MTSFDNVPSAAGQTSDAYTTLSDGLRPDLGEALRFLTILDPTADSFTFGAYADVASALEMEFTLLPARRPTLDEVAELLANE